MLTLVLGDPMPEMLTEEEGNRGIRNLSETNLLRIPLKPKAGQVTKNKYIFSITFILHWTVGDLRCCMSTDKISRSDNKYLNKTTLDF